MFLLADLGLLLIRAMVGFVFIFYGTQKLFGWFGGYRIKGTEGWLVSTEILFILGFFLPLGTALISIMVISSIVKVHGQKGFQKTVGGHSILDAANVQYMNAGWAARYAEETAEKQNKI